jgi:hypothetical protein
MTAEAAAAASTPKLRLIKTLWGIDDPISTSLFRSIKDEGYDGVEIIRLAWKEALNDFNVNQRDNNDNNSRSTSTSVSTASTRNSTSGSTLINCLNDTGLQVVCQIHTAGGYITSPDNGNSVGSGEYVYCGAYDVAAHMTSFQEQLNECTEFLTHIDAGGFVNVHAGCDAWSIDEAMDFLTTSLRLIDDSQLPFQVTFETHRQRLFGSPFQTREILSHQHGAASRSLSQLRLNADLSHWYCSCERVFDPREPRDEPWWPQLLEQLAIHCTYIHARFGWAQGPQLADPSASEHTVERELQLKTWKRLLKSMKNRRPQRLSNSNSRSAPTTNYDNASSSSASFADSSTVIECYVSPEYGPPPYLPVIPHTQTPVASLPSAVEYTKKLLIELIDEE